MRTFYTLTQLKETLKKVQHFSHFLGVAFWCLVLGYGGFLTLLYFQSSKGRVDPSLAGVAKVTAGQKNGSAFLVKGKDGNKYLLTAEHLISGQSRVKLNFHKVDAACDAEVVFADIQGDIAVLKPVNLSRDIPPMSLGDSDFLQEQETILVIGYPGGEWHITKGIVAAKLKGEIRTDAAVNPGNSGGPLVVEKTKKAVGMLVRGWGEGRHAAIPINLIKDVLKKQQKDHFIE